MAEPAAKGNCFLNPKGYRKSLEVAPLRPIADERKVGQIVSQNLSSRTETEIAGFSANETANENQREFGARFRNCVYQRNRVSERYHSPAQKTACRDTRQTRAYGT